MRTVRGGTRKSIQTNENAEETELIGKREKIKNWESACGGKGGDRGREREREQAHDSRTETSLGLR